ncbi:MerR family transcriptional regulator [Klugiella xanthotipulae]|uniref:DNA-binding transcriptional MerR regulator n=1 Tax=Klugiella xanthotipulae TaxID=244735 RepID=A0A543I6T0_9MICO|nr:MerR family transcriptional regulator [Klugiella xanthotipulae]TQM66265.1 DNA-binding transcriptional MerR regulator [Klugiella xanthotipulae]
MKIGELSARTGVVARLLRYYEEQELLFPERTANGYRAYAESDVERVRNIRELLDSGIPTWIIRRILPCVMNCGSPSDASVVPSIDAETARVLNQERERLTCKVECLTRNRDAIALYLSKAQW